MPASNGGHFIFYTHYFTQNNIYYKMFVNFAIS